MIDEQPESRHGAPFILFALLHLVRCGIPVLVLSGVSLAFSPRRGRSSARRFSSTAE